MGGRDRAGGLLELNERCKCEGKCFDEGGDEWQLIGIKVNRKFYRYDMKTKVNNKEEVIKSQMSFAIVESWSIRIKKFY